MPCTEFGEDVYNLYVLGLLEDGQRVRVDSHIQDNCADCIRDVQRAMNLWVVFANTLEVAEPSTDFRARLLRITELSKKVLTFPKGSTDYRPHAMPWWTVALLLALVVATLTGAWRAGVRSSDLGEERMKNELNSLNQQIASTQLELQQVTASRQDLERAVRSSGKSSFVDEQRKMHQQLLEWQSSADQYKAVIDRQQRLLEQNMQLVTALSSPGVHLLPMKGAEAAAASTAYVLLVEKSKLMVVASNLPKLPMDKQFQLWLIRKQEPKIVNAGVFTPDDDNRAIMNFNDSSIIWDISSLAITNEPQGGSAAPTGSKLLVASNNGPEQEDNQIHDR